jgi:hypothetical protein
MVTPFRPTLGSIHTYSLFLTDARKYRGWVTTITYSVITYLWIDVTNSIRSMGAHPSQRPGETTSRPLWIECSRYTRKILGLLSRISIASFKSFRLSDSTNLRARGPTPISQQSLLLLNLAPRSIVLRKRSSLTILWTRSRFLNHLSISLFRVHPRARFVVLLHLWSAHTYLFDHHIGLLSSILDLRPRIHSLIR